MSAKSLEQWLDWQLELHTKEIDLGLDRVSRVWQAMGAPTIADKVITIAGTNGKGSTVAFCEAIYHAAGYRVGCYTSPHLLRYNERIRLDHQLASDEQIISAFEAIDQARGEIPLTYFEFGTLAALWLLAQSQMEIAILEVGLGGRLDAVNIIDADVAVITSIGLDHMDWLGDSIDKIGFEKAGVMRKGHPAVLAAKDLPPSIKAHADKVGAKTFMLGEQYHFEQIAGGWSWQGQNRTRRALPLPSMRGSVQLQNAAAALQVVELLEETFPVDQNAAKSGLIDAKVFGRFDIYQHKARFVVDVGHNPEAVGHLASHLGDLFVPGKVHAIVGMLKDKSIAETLAVIAPRIEQWHLLDLSDNPRGASAERLAECLPAEVDKQTYASAKDALDTLDAELSSDDLVVVFGSFVTVGATLEWLGEMPT